MYNYILSAGLIVVAEGNFNLVVDIEINENRQAVYYGLRAWQRDVFAAAKRGLITQREMIQIFSEVVSEAVSNYNCARAELSNQSTQVAEVVVDEVAELKAQLASAKEAIAKKNSVIHTQEALINKYEAKIDSLKTKNLVEVTNRTMLVGRTITNVQVNVPVVI
jgi:hypothetical protein